MQHKRPLRRPAVGFKWIELLRAIAIFAILAAMLVRGLFVTPSLAADAVPPKPILDVAAIDGERILKAARAALECAAAREPDAARLRACRTLHADDGSGRALHL